MLFRLLDWWFHHRDRSGQCYDDCWCVLLARIAADYDIEDLVA
jgi:hypothetical protein